MPQKLFKNLLSTDIWFFIFIDSALLLKGIFAYYRRVSVFVSIAAGAVYSLLKASV
jgi:hypothetical protein